MAGCSQQLVSYWLKHGCPLPAEYVQRVAAALAISPQDLRPDIFSPVLEPTAPAATVGGERGNAPGDQQDTSAPARLGSAPSPDPTPVRQREDVAPDASSTTAPNRWAGRTVTCALCERRLSETTVRACQAQDCPQADREAA